MLFSEPNRTAYDLNFSLLGFPVRVHPLFFVLPIVLGARFAGGDFNAGLAITVFVLLFFVSILLHELGHALAFRYFGQPARIVLHMFGGLAIPDAGRWNSGRARRRTPSDEIMITLAGPAANFLIAALLVGVVFALGGQIVPQWLGLVPSLRPNFEGSAVAVTEGLWLLLVMGIWLNIVWGILNLMPVLPLDGGQIALRLFQLSDPYQATQRAVYLSLGVAVFLAVAGFLTGDRFIGLFFLFLAISTWMTIQQSGGGWGGPYGGRGY